VALSQPIGGLVPETSLLIFATVIVYGYEWLSKQVRRLEKWLDEKGYESLADIYGTSADSALT